MSEKVVNISTEYIKLDSFLKFCGLTMTGGQAKDLIMDGKVKVGGEICIQRGRKLRPGDVVEVEGDTTRYKVSSENQ